jgi:hypothetical protein
MAAETPSPGAAPGRTRTYVLVLLIESLVVVALWAFGHYFGSQ